MCVHVGLMLTHNGHGWTERLTPGRQNFECHRGGMKLSTRTVRGKCGMKYEFSPVGLSHSEDRDQLKGKALPREKEQ